MRDAAMHGTLDVCKKWAETADINELEASSGRTALHKACFWGHIETVQFLLSQGIKVDIQDYNGDTALHDAVHFGHTPVVEALLKHGANTRLMNNAGKTPADVAISQEKPHLAELINSSKL
mmetsp:Transcript_27168/g.42290  ORF Transcript_27168/g.42290 Transcript_27168/m.42290 type:complete len:121 (-) Transcript_27168:54-416(-)